MLATPSAARNVRIWGSVSFASGQRSQARRQEANENLTQLVGLNGLRQCRVHSATMQVSICSGGAVDRLPMAQLLLDLLRMLAMAWGGAGGRKAVHPRM